MTLAILYHEKVKRSQEKVGGASVLIIACVAYSKLRSLQGQVAQEGGAVLGEGEGRQRPKRCSHKKMEQFQDKMEGASSLNVACVACVAFSVKMEKLSSRHLNVACVACVEFSVKMEKLSSRHRADIPTTELYLFRMRPPSS
ncbi:hypothetical protein PF003_g13804 [Phytophthora fragariae]|nr:hypothetical protein PF003_g13804 [Phytophthora fragariae]